MGIGAAAVIGGGMALGALGGYLGSRQQSNAAREAAEMQRELGREASGIILRSEAGAANYLRSGSARQRQELYNIAGMYGDEASRVRGLGQQAAGMYDPARQVGDESLQRLRAALLDGDMSGFEQSPGYQFRMQQGQQAIERAAAAAGSYGSGANLKDLTRFGQGVASQEYGSYVNRLLGLQQIGAQATDRSVQTGLAYHGMEQSLLGARAGAMGQRAAVAGGLGSALAGLRSSTAANQANALTGAGSQAIQYDLAGAQASAQGTAGIGNAIQQGAMLYALMGMPGMGGGSGSTPMTTGRAADLNYRGGF